MMTFYYEQEEKEQQLGQQGATHMHFMKDCVFK